MKCLSSLITVSQTKKTGGRLRLTRTSQSASSDMKVLGERRSRDRKKRTHQSLDSSKAAPAAIKNDFQHQFKQAETTVVVPATLERSRGDINSAVAMETCNTASDHFSDAMSSERNLSHGLIAARTHKEPVSKFRRQPWKRGIVSGWDQSSHFHSHRWADGGGGCQRVLSLLCEQNYPEQLKGAVNKSVCASLSEDERQIRPVRLGLLHCLLCSLLLSQLLWSSTALIQDPAIWPH